MTPDDLDRLEALAAAARDEGEEGWYDEQIFLSMIDGADDAVVAEEDAALIAALSPSVVSDLIAAARLGAAWEAAEGARPQGWSLVVMGHDTWAHAEYQTSSTGNVRGPQRLTGKDIPALLSLAEALRGRK